MSRVRVPVQFRAKGRKPARYVYMLKETADYFGFKIAALTKKNSKGYTIPVRGSTGAGSISLPTKIAATAKVNGKTVKYFKRRKVPVPGDTNLTEIRAFVNRATRNKPETFASVDGIVHPVSVR